MEGPVLMECYEDVFEEIASKFYSDEPLNKTVISAEPFMRFSARLRAGTVPPLPTQSQYTLTHTENGLKTPSSDTNSDEIWIESSENLTWSPSKVARYNPTTKMYKCVDCDTVGFLSRIAEHWLGAHANLKVFRCPRCPYSSAWARCVRMHLTRHHNEQHSDAALWKDNVALDEVTKLLQNLRHNADSRNTSDGESVSQGADGVSDKRYACPQCPYATDRRDLYTRHENIHKDEKPFHCYICYKMFSRADHVKKHFFRMHKDRPYDINQIRRLPVKNNSNNNNFIPRSNNNNNNNNNISNNNINGDNSNTLNMYYTSNSSSNNNIINHNNTSVPAFSGVPINRSSEVVARNSGRVRNSSSDGQFSLSSKKRHLPKMFSCTYCAWRGVDNWCLKRHLNTHIKPYLCVLCDYKAARAERLSTHVLKIHNKRICNKCSFLAEDQVQLNRHAREAHHDRNLVKCEDCTETFDGPSELETHGIMAHNKDLLDCEHCDFKTTHSKSLERHKEERHSQDAKKNNNTCKKEIRCRECGCEFANQSSLQTHILLLHRKENSNSFRSCTYLCSLCQYGCSSQTNMMEHMRVHTGEMLQCLAEECNFRTPFDSVLREHVEFMHDDDFIVRCPHCGFSLNSRQTLASHFPLHHPRLCPLCVAVIRKHFPTKEESLTAENSGENVNRYNGLLDLSSCESQVDMQIVSQVKRSRKQSKPRKIIQTDEDEEEEEEIDQDEFKNSPKTKRRKSSVSSPTPSTSSNKSFFFLPQYRCRQCRPSLSFNHKKNWLLHVRWNHVRKRFSCEHCPQTYTHQYQVLLHASRDHVIQRL